MKSRISVALRAAITATVCLSLVVVPQSRVAAMDVKSAAEYKAEALRFDNAIRAMAGITTMKLETPDDLKAALAIVERESGNVTLLLSKLVAMGLADSTVVAAVKKRGPTAKEAEAFFKAIIADPQKVLNLEGGSALSTRMRSVITSSAETLKRAGTRLREAADKIKTRGSTGSEGGNEMRLVRASYSVATGASAGPSVFAVAVGLVDPLTVAAAAAIYVVAVIFAAAFILQLVEVIKNVVTPEGQRRVERCLADARARLDRCWAEARQQPWPSDLAALAACDAFYLLDVASCYT
jgi:hypothetical protein